MPMPLWFFSNATNANDVSESDTEDVQDIQDFQEIQEDETLNEILENALDDKSDIDVQDDINIQLQPPLLRVNPTFKEGSFLEPGHHIGIDTFDNEQEFVPNKINKSNDIIAPAYDSNMDKLSSIKMFRKPLLNPASINELNGCNLDKNVITDLFDNNERYKNYVLPGGYNYPIPVKKQPNIQLRNEPSVSITPTNVEIKNKDAEPIIPNDTKVNENCQVTNEHNGNVINISYKFGESFDMKVSCNWIINTVCLALFISNYINVV